VRRRKVKRQPLSLEDKVRARIEMHGGRATSSQVLPYVGATAVEVKALPGIVVTQERQRVGRPAVVFSLADDSARDTERMKPEVVAAGQRAEPDGTRAKVVLMDAYRPEPKQAPEREPEPQRSEPLADSNPFRALL